MPRRPLAPGGARPACPEIHSSIVVLLALSLFLPVVCRAEDRDAERSAALWGANNWVLAVARAGNTLFAGGYFNRMGPITGACVPVDPSSGRVRSRYPQVAGTVRVIVSDGEGGRYMGGAFVGVGGVPRQNLAHVLADGTVAQWAPDPNGTIVALAVSGRTVYVGGNYTMIGGQSRWFLSAVDARTGRVTAWDPHPDAAVWSVLVSNRRLYVGGDFSRVGGVPRRNAAAFDERSGEVLPWAPEPDARIRVLAEFRRTILAGGEFETIGGQVRPALAAVDADSGKATAWNPRPMQPIPMRGLGWPTVTVNTMRPSGGRLFVGGIFKTIGGQPRGGLAAVDLVTGMATPWNPIPVADTTNPSGSSTTAMDLRGRTLYLSGYYPGDVAAVDIETGLARNWDPHPNSSVLALSAERDGIWLGGNFNGFDWRPQPCLVALDLRTGAPTPWSPHLSGIAVQSLALSGNTLYIGGVFDSVGSQPRRCLAAIDATTGTVLPWNPGASPGEYNTNIYTLLPIGDRVYVGGGFSKLGGQPRFNLGAVDTLTGAATNWNPATDDWVEGLAARGRKIYAVGWFEQIAGAPRHFLAAIDSATGAAEPWNPGANSDLNTVALSGDTVFVGGYFTSIGRVNRSYMAALDADSGRVLDWNPSPNGQVRVLAVNGGRIYAGGDFSSIGGQPRQFIASLDPATGQATSWNAASSNWVGALAFDASSVYAAGNFNAMGAQSVGMLTGVPADLATRRPPRRAELALAEGATTFWLAPSAPNPATAGTTIRYSIPSAGPVDLEVFDVQGRSVAKLVDRVEQPAGQFVVSVPTQEWKAGVYLYRLRANGASVTRKLLVEH